MIKKYLYMALGFACLGMAYVGVVVPGIPFSIFFLFSLELILSRGRLYIRPSPYTV